MADADGRTPRRNWLAAMGIPHLVWVFIAFFYVSGLVTVAMQHNVNVPVALLCSMAFAVFGSLAGFVFGIPRTLSAAEPSMAGSAAREPQGAVQGRAGSTYIVNTNLEQISDWVTKILVGIGLSRIGEIPNGISALSSYLASGLGGPQESTRVLALAIVIYFSVVGFLGGYLVTRLVLQIAFTLADQTPKSPANGA